MRYEDSKNRPRRLTRTQGSYLEQAERGRLRRGWGGYNSTIAVRLLEERGLVTVRWGYDREWEITGLTHLGQAVCKRWVARQYPGR